MYIRLRQRFPQPFVDKVFNPKGIQGFAEIHYSFHSIVFDREEA
jgi:hypothetical protein